MSVDSLMASAQLAVLEWLTGNGDRFAETLKRMARDVGGAWPRPDSSEAASFAECSVLRVSEPDQSHICGACDRFHSTELPCVTPADEAWAMFADGDARGAKFCPTPCEATLTPEDIERNARDYNGHGPVCSDCHARLCEDAQIESEAAEFYAAGADRTDEF
jgi:hypothetical protein